MPFVKLDTGLLNSTLWVEYDSRDIFITALLMAEPRELTEPAPQLKIDSLEKTGFVVPVGWYGFVKAAGIGIIRMNGRLDRETGLKALEILGQPDNESRSSDFEGRRMVRVDGGFVILNYIKYRDRDATTAERSRRWRQRQKERQEQQRSSVAQHRDATANDTRRHQAEAEAEAEAEVQSSAFGKSSSDITSTTKEQQHGRAVWLETFQPSNPEYKQSEYSDWIAIKNHLRTQIGEEAWDLWLRPMYLVKVLSGKALLLSLPPATKVVEAARKNKGILLEALKRRGYQLAGFTKYPSEWELKKIRGKA